VVPPTVKGLSLVSLFNDFASEMVYPLLPAFVTHGLGGGALMLGALDGAADLTSALLRWVSGRLADRPGWRKPLILWGYATAVLVRPLMAVTTAAWQVVGFRVIDRVGKGLRSPARDALISDVTPVGEKGRAFGFHRAADHFGAVLGSLAGWALLSAAVDVRTVIGWSAVPGVVVVLVLIPVLRRAGGGAPPSPPAVTATLAEPAPGTGGSDQRRLRVSPASGPPTTEDSTGRWFWFPALALVVLTVGRLPETLILLRLQDVGVPVVTIPLAWAGLHVVRTVAAYPGGWLSDRVGPRATVAFGGIVLAVVLALLARSVSPIVAVALLLSMGMVSGLTEAAEKATIAALAPVRTGTGFGSYQAVAGIASLPLALGFGGVYQQAGGPTALVLSAGVIGLGVVAWWIAAGSRFSGTGVEATQD
jgi:MFS family permease